jgi:formylglycine-generating enzyme required for sulfatase activity
MQAKRSRTALTSGGEEPVAVIPASSTKKPGVGVRGESNPGDTMTDPATGMELVYIPKGCFMMGSDKYSNAKPVHDVCVDGFYMGKYEVTQGQWQKVMGKNPSMLQKGDNYPVESISYDDVKEFIRKLNEKSGDYRLPTEAEWEYACRANGSGKYCGGDNLDALAWYDKNSGNSTHPVGGKKANTFGLHDMSGNVWEWCADWYGKNYYASSPKDNPHGPDRGERRILRSGSYFLNTLYSRAVFRGSDPPGLRQVHFGFRLVLPVR